MRVRRLRRITGIHVMATATRTIRAAARHRAHLQRLAAGSGAADADEQSRSRRRRTARRSGRLRRIGKAARNWPAFDAIVRSLTTLERRRNAARPVRQAGRRLPDARRRAARAHRQRLLVPAWATWENFRDLEHRGLTMYGQMTAGSWIYIGTQGIVQGTYETFAAVARRHFGGIARRPARRHRRARRDGRRPAARRRA